MKEKELYLQKPVWKVIDFFLGFFGTIVAGACFLIPFIGFVFLLLLFGLFVFFCTKGHYYLGVGFAALMATGVVGLLILFGSCLLTGGNL